jgi:hypothetical protein
MARDGPIAGDRPKPELGVSGMICAFQSQIARIRTNCQGNPRFALSPRAK